MSNDPVVFKNTCIKTLSAVEARPERSNQHEFNGVQELKKMFGLTGFTRRAIFSLRGSTIISHTDVTWYDAREAHPTRTEHRLYFKSNPVMDKAQEGDDIVLAFDAADNLHCVLIKRGSQGHTGTAEGWKKI